MGGGLGKREVAVCERDNSSPNSKKKKKWATILYSKITTAVDKID